MKNTFTRKQTTQITEIVQDIAEDFAEDACMPYTIVEWIGYVSDIADAINHKGLVRKLTKGNEDIVEEFRAIAYDAVKESNQLDYTIKQEMLAIIHDEVKAREMQAQDLRMRTQKQVNMMGNIISLMKKPLLNAKNTTEFYSIIDKQTELIEEFYEKFYDIANN